MMLVTPIRAFLTNLFWKTPGLPISTVMEGIPRIIAAPRKEPPGLVLCTMILEISQTEM